MILILYCLACLSFIPCVLCGKMANIDNPHLGVDKTLACWSLAFGLLGNFLGITVMVWAFARAVLRE